MAVYKTVCNLENEQIVNVIENKAPYDIVVISHSLNELWKNKTEDERLQNKSRLILSLLDFLSPNAFVILNEPALLKTSRELIALRNILVQNAYKVLSPCMQSEQCPALTQGNGITCNAQLQWKCIEPVAAIAHLAGLDREAIKMTFFLMQKKDATKESEKSCKDTNSFRAKVVSDPMKNKAGRIRYILCNGKERISFSALEKRGEADRENYKTFLSLARYDTIIIEDFELRAEGTALGFTDNTKINVIN